MKNTIRIAALLALAACALHAQLTPKAVVLTAGEWVDIGSLLSDPYSFALALNDAGTIVGYSETPTLPARRLAFRYSGGVMSSLGTLGGSNSEARAINSSGQIVGVAQRSDGGHSAFLYASGSMSDLGQLGGVNSEAHGISDTGVIVGCSDTTTPGERHAFRYSSGTMTDLGTLGGSPLSCAYGISKDGSVVAGVSNGRFSETEVLADNHVFSWESGVMTDLGAPSGRLSHYPMGVNDSGQIVGKTRSPGSTATGYYFDGAFDVIPVLGGGIWSSATTLNNAGQVVGYGNSGHPLMHTIGGSLTDLGVAKGGGGSWTSVVPRGINNSGAVVGWAY